MVKKDDIDYGEMPLHVAKANSIIPTELYEFLNSKMGGDRKTVATLGLLYQRYTDNPEFLSQYKGLQSKGQKYQRLQSHLEAMFDKPEFDKIKQQYNVKDTYTSEEMDEVLEMLDISENNKHEAELKVAEQESEIVAKDARIAALEQKLAAPPTIENLLPDDLSIVGEWASVVYPHRFLITPRALSEVQDPAYNVYRAPQKVFFGLSALATDYREARILDGEKQQDLILRAERRFVDRLSSQGISDDHSLTKTAASKFGRLYKAQVDDTSYTLTRHLKHGVSRDPAGCMRIYYTFDQDSGKVVIGSLPRHLTNSMT